MMRFMILLVISIATFVQSNLDSVSGIHDLTWDFEKRTIYWPNYKTFTFTKKTGNNDRGYWYAANEFCAAEHGGTHFDAPYHFSENGWKVADVPTDRLVGKGAIINLENKTAVFGGNATLEVSDLEQWQIENGEFPRGSILLVKFGWSKFWPDNTLYLGKRADGSLDFPGISKGAAEWLAKSGKFYGVGLDTASADPGSSTEFNAHRILAKGAMYIMENVKINIDLPAHGFLLVAMPMKLKDGTGAPLRLLAFTY